MALQCLLKNSHSIKMESESIVLCQIQPGNFTKGILKSWSTEDYTWLKLTIIWRKIVLKYEAMHL